MTATTEVRFVIRTARGSELLVASEHHARGVKEFVSIDLPQSSGALLDEHDVEGLVAYLSERLKAHRARTKRKGAK